MRFHDPVWLYGLLALPLLAFAAWHGMRISARALGLFAGSGAASRLVDTGVFTRRKVRTAALVLAAGAVMLSLARPQYGVKPIRLKSAGVDVMIALDTSNSMAAADVKPSRMERAKSELGRFISAIEGNRMGLIIFAGASFLESPLTLDAGAVRMTLDSVGVGAVPRPGTAIDKAVAEAVRAFKTSEAKSKVLVTVTDGENLSEGNVRAAAAAAREAGITIFAIGIGSAAGAPVPEFGEDGKPAGFKKDKSGAPILTRLDTETLAALADTTGGRFYVSEGESLDLAALTEQLKKMEKTDIGSFEFTEYEERFQPVLLVALIVLAMEYFYFTGFFGFALRCRART